MIKFFSEILYILGDHRKKVPYVIFLFLLLSVLDLLSLGLIAPYVALLMDNEMPVLENIVFFDQYDNIFFIDTENKIVFFSIVLITIFLIKVCMIYYVNRSIYLFCNGFLVQTRAQLMMYYQYMPYSEFLERNSADVMNNIIVLASKTNTLVLALLRMISDIMTGVAIVLLLFFTDPIMLILLLSLLLTIAWVYDTFFKNKIFDYGKIEDNAGKEVFKGVRESLDGLRDIRIFGKEKYFFNIVKNGVIKGVEGNLKSNLIQVMPRYIFEFFMLSFIILFVIINIYLNRSIDNFLPVVAVFAIASIRIMPVLSGISNGLLAVRGSKYAVHKIYKDLSGKNSREKNQSISPQKKYDGIDKSFCYLEFDHVSFSYDGCENQKYALNDVSMKIHKNETIGIIGESGSGKTTLLNIMLGLLCPKNGCVYYNDIPLDSVINKWREKVAYLPQQVFLIDDTLRRNIALGEHENDIIESRVLNAVKKAKLFDYTMSLADGINTYIGESGVRLSGGQRQRIALARSFYFERDVLIMDEATSALDNETEEEIIEEIRCMRHKKTVIIIAHRLSTVRHCDRIYKMKEGKIVDTGSYKEVVQNANNKL